MSVYVDRLTGFAPFTAHMMADSSPELESMARRIGLKPEWIQKAGSRFEHYDLMESKRRLAVKYGAIEVSGRDLVHRFRDRT